MRLSYSPMRAYGELRPSGPISASCPTLTARTADVQRELGLREPVWWAGDILGDYLWSKQQEIMLSVRDNRRTAVQACHGPGKSHVAGRVIAWWIACHPIGEARVVTTAPTGDQVRAVLWQEVARAHSSGHLPGRLNQTEWWVTLPDGREELVGIGRKPAEHNPSAMQGIHERYVLVVIDEAGGVPSSLWAAIDGLLSNEECRLLAIGNPDDPTSEFARECAPGSGANVIRISAFDTPNFTGEWVPDAARHRLTSRIWVEEKRRKWGEDNPFYISKVLGLFPEIAEDVLIPPAWIRAAQSRDLTAAADDPIELGVDVGGGGNKSVIAHRHGPVVRILTRDRDPNTMATTGRVIDAIRRTSAETAKVDKYGIGYSVVDRAAEIAGDTMQPRTTREAASCVDGVLVGQPATDSESFANLRAEGYWGLRERFQDGTIDLDPDDDDLAAQLVDIRWKRTSAGKILIESKEEMMKRGRASPDEADAVMLAFLRVPGLRAGTWGR
jgi:hypothetical protein